MVSKLSVPQFDVYCDDYACLVRYDQNVVEDLLVCLCNRTNLLIADGAPGLNNPSETFYMPTHAPRKI